MSANVFLMVSQSAQGIIRFCLLDLVLDLLIFRFNTFVFVLFVYRVQRPWTFLVKEWEWAQTRSLNRLVNHSRAVMLNDLAYARVQFHIFGHKPLLSTTSSRISNRQILCQLTLTLYSQNKLPSINETYLCFFMNMFVSSCLIFLVLIIAVFSGEFSPVSVLPLTFSRA